MLPVFMILRCKIYFMRASARNTVFSKKINFIDRLKGDGMSLFFHLSQVKRR